MMARQLPAGVITRQTDSRGDLERYLDPVAKLIPEGGMVIGVIDNRGAWGGFFELPGEYGPRSFVCGGPLARELCWYALTEILFGEDYDSIRSQLTRIGYFRHS